MFLTRIWSLIEHREIMSGFPKTESLTPRSDFQVLFRHDAQITLIQSNIRPLLENSQTRQVTIEPVIGRSYYFRTAINSVSKQSRTRKQFSVQPDDWLKSRDFGADFSVQSAIQTLRVEESKGRKVPIDHWTLWGTLVVTDSDRLTSVIRSGIGRGRAWGCGLLSIVEA